MLGFVVLVAFVFSGDWDSLLEEFWSAPTVAERDGLAGEIVASGASFDEVFGRLQGGRSYGEEVSRGKLFFEHAIDGVRHPYMVLVPSGYTPRREWPVRFGLHGGMGAKEWTDLDGKWSPGWRPNEDWIVVVLAGWWDSMWWGRGWIGTCSQGKTIRFAFHRSARKSSSVSFGTPCATRSPVNSHGRPRIRGVTVDVHGS